MLADISSVDAIYTSVAYPHSIFILIFSKYKDVC